LRANDSVVRRVTRKPGQGGDLAYYVEVQGPNGAARHFSLSGNIFTGPVALVGKDEKGRRYDEVVPHPRRFGEFISAQWVHRFFESRQHNLA
jgi:hypothetical protein